MPNPKDGTDWENNSLSLARFFFFFFSTLTKKQRWIRQQKYYQSISPKPLEAPTLPFRSAHAQPSLLPGCRVLTGGWVSSYFHAWQNELQLWPTTPTHPTTDPAGSGNFTAHVGPLIARTLTHWQLVWDLREEVTLTEVGAFNRCKRLI